MKDYTVTDPSFSETIQITETTDTNHADNINYAPKQIYENTLYNKNSIDTINDTISDVLVTDDVGSHNGIFRGKDLTDVYTIEELHEKVSGGDFSDLYIGDYVTISITTDTGGTEDVDMVVACFDYFYNCGTTALTSHHLVLVPRDNFQTTAHMNDSNTTEGGYSGSYMHATLLPEYFTALNSALGGNLLTHYRYLTTVVSTSADSAGGAGLTGSSTTCAWQGTDACLMSEAMVYGGAIFSSSGRDISDACIQLPLFRLRPDYRVAYLGKDGTSRCGFWLCGVASASHFCYCSHSGYASYTSASGACGVRPYVLFG